MHLQPILVALILAAAVPPAADQDAVESGRDLFADNCVDCHGATADEGRGGSIRGVNLRKVRKATGGGFEDMPEFELTEDDLHALVAFLGSL